MTRMRLYIHVLCLITFTWAATCLGETLAVYQYGDDAHSQATLLDGSDQTWVFHHNGHQDQHEKQALDAECASGGQSHGDHVVKRGCASIASPRAIEPSVPFKLPAALLVEQPQFIPLTSAATPIPAALFELVPPTRNSSLAIVKLTRLRI